MMQQPPQTDIPGHDRVYPVLVAQIYRRSNIGIYATIVNASFLILVLWDQVQYGALITWFAMIVLASLVRMGLNRAYRARPSDQRDPRTWGRLLVGGLAISGTLWGAAAILLFPANSVAHQVFIAFVLAGMVGGAVGVFSPIMSVFLAFSLPALVPIIIRFFVIGDAMHLAMGAMTALFALLTFTTARQINNSTRELVALKETFADQLDQRTSELKAANAHLTLEIGERKQIEKALSDSQRQLMDIIEFLPDPTWVVDVRGRVIAWNRAIERLTGVTKNEMIGKDFASYSVPFHGEPRPMLIDSMLQRGKGFPDSFACREDEPGKMVASESFRSNRGDQKCFASTASRLCDMQGNLVGAIESIRDVTTAKRMEEERERLIEELQDTIAKVRTLSGLLPICSSCKKIRDDQGYWNQIEAYISQHSKAEFSHSICPECAKTLYPDLDF